jgi:thiamine biosynthesis lipoprotein
MFLLESPRQSQKPVAGLELHTRSFAAMGTRCGLHLYADGPNAAEHAFSAAIDELRRIESRYSRYRHDSYLSHINRVAQAGGSLEVDDETAGLLNYAFAAWQRSQGLFDITSGLLRQAWDFKSGRLPEQESLDQLLPRVGLDKVRWDPPHLCFTRPGMELDFGGIAKEYAADRAAAACIAAGARHGLVDLGGDIRIIGPHPDGRPWHLAIRHPRRRGEMMASVAIDRGGLATSGDYERCIEFNGRRYGHILLPATGWPAQGLSSVSVIAEQCLLAGTLSTIAMLKGDQGPPWLKGLCVPHVWMDDRGAWGACTETGPGFEVSNAPTFSGSQDKSSHSPQMESKGE